MLGVFESRGAVWMPSNISGGVGNFGSKCNSSQPVLVMDVATNGMLCLLNSPYTITLTDGNIGSPNTVSVSSLTRFPNGVLKTGGGSTPTLNLTTLDPGPGTLVVTDPCGNTTTIGYNIVSCSSSSALIPQFGLPYLIAPNRVMTYTIAVASVGPNPSLPVTLEITGIPAATICTVSALLSTDMTLATGGGGQQININMASPIPAGQLVYYTFGMQATPSAVLGSTFTLNAAFTSTYAYTDSRLVTIVASIDPNAKYGPTGNGPMHDINPNTILPYLITFENDPSALAPAQIVKITDLLDTSKVWPETVAFGPVHYGNQIITPPSGTIPFTMTVPYDVDGNPLTLADNIYVKVSGNVDQNPFSGTYGKIEWTFESLDAPGGVPPPITIGFLPPNVNAPEGQGGVTFSVLQKLNLAPATLITNDASIVFDVNAPILTPVWTNRIRILSTLTIDRAGSGMVRVTWTGGTLEEAPTVTGNSWSDAPVQTSPWTFDPVAPMKFFRVRND